MSSLVLASLASWSAQSTRTTRPEEPITAPPAAISSNGFYTKCVYFRGIPIIGSEHVADQAFRTIIVTFTKMLANVPESTTDQLIKSGTHYSIIASVEGQTDLPEYRSMKNDPNTDW